MYGQLHVGRYALNLLLSQVRGSTRSSVSGPTTEGGGPVRSHPNFGIEETDSRRYDEEFSGPNVAAHGLVDDST